MSAPKWLKSWLGVEAADQAELSADLLEARRDLDALLAAVPNARGFLPGSAMSKRPFPARAASFGTLIVLGLFAFVGYITAKQLDAGMPIELIGAVAVAISVTAGSYLSLYEFFESRQTKRAWLLAVTTAVGVVGAVIVATVALPKIA